MTKPREISDETLDRLVDGELPEAERRALLLSLDGRPDEWRRCALAFLEAQTWKDGLGDMLKPQSQVATVKPIAKSFVWRTYLAVAASFLVAFGLATWLNRQPGGEGQRPAVANAVAVNNSTASNETASDSVPDEGTTNTPESIRLTLAGQGNERQSIDVPVVNDAGQLQSLFAENPNVLPSYVRERIERSGHRIEQHRELLPVELNDGRQIVIPVDRLDLHYVGGRNVQ